MNDLQFGPGQLLKNQGAPINSEPHELSPGVSKTTMPLAKQQLKLFHPESCITS